MPTASSSAVSANLLDVVLHPDAGPRGPCVDTAGWSNGKGKACVDYAGAGWCAGGVLRPEWEWIGGSPFHQPELHCCACGREEAQRRAVIAQAAAVAAAAPKTAAGYTHHANAYCRAADRGALTMDTQAKCEQHGASRKVACTHWGEGICRFTYTFQGLVASDKGYSAFVRPGASTSSSALKVCNFGSCAHAGRALTFSLAFLPPTPPALHLISLRPRVPYIFSVSPSHKGACRKAKGRRGGGGRRRPRQLLPTARA